MSEVSIIGIGIACFLWGAFAAWWYMTPVPLLPVAKGVKRDPTMQAIVDDAIRAGEILYGLGALHAVDCINHGHGVMAHIDIDTSVLRKYRIVPCLCQAEDGSGRGRLHFVEIPEQ